MAVEKKGTARTGKAAGSPEKKAGGNRKAVKAPASRLKIYIQSPWGGNITPEEIEAKMPEGVDTVYVRVDHNKLWWVRGEETGSEEIW